MTNIKATAPQLKNTDGILIINKPDKLTSHDVVLKIRHKTKQRKVGHAGTLDPLATGVLILVLGRATKLVSKLINQDKEYEVTMRLGIKTNTGDITGKTIEQHEVGTIDRENLEQLLLKFQGEQLQTPPMVSAKKHKGRPLYKYARQGKVIFREPKQINIYQLKLEEIKLPEISLYVSCSKGTYIRTLCEDIGSSLGPGACASRIHRTRSGNFNIEQAIDLDELLKMDLAEIKKRLITSI